MISKELITSQLNDFLKEKNLFIVDIAISFNNNVDVIIDGDNYVDIDQCVEVSRYIESFLNRDIEDYSLIVSSPDATKPLQLPRQYPKHIGKEIKILTNDNKEFTGKILSANESELTISLKTKDKQNKKRIIEQEMTIPFNQIKKAKIKLPF
jgi:ribosome maturation factor RimP